MTHYPSDLRPDPRGSSYAWEVRKWNQKIYMILLRVVKGREIISFCMQKIELREGFYVWFWLMFLVLGRFSHMNQKEIANQQADVEIWEKRHLPNGRRQESEVGEAGSRTTHGPRLQAPRASSMLPLDWLTEQKPQNKIIKNFKMATAKYYKLKCGALNVSPM